MALRTIFVQELLEGQHSCQLSAEQLHHLRDVLRLPEGRRLILRDAAGKSYWASWTLEAEREGRLDLEGRAELGAEAGPRLHLWQCLPKAGKMDDIVRKSVELGVYALHPVESARCVSKLDRKGLASKRERWAKISQAAAEQAGRDRVPEIDEAWRLPKLFELSGGSGSPDSDGGAFLDAERELRIMAWEEEEGLSLRALLETYLRQEEAEACGLEQVHVLIGPEGGFSSEEARQAREAGWRTVGLGPRILRTETAGPAVLSMLNIALPGRML